MESSSFKLNQHGNAYFSRGDYVNAYQCYAKALKVDREKGEQRSLVITLGNLGNICAVNDRVDEAKQYYREVLGLYRSLGDNRGISITLVNLGNLSADCKDWERARAH